MAALVVAANDGFGAGDVPVFAFWSVLLAILIATLAPPVLRRLGRRRRPTAALLAALSGAAAGTVFTFAVALGLGPWVGAFSFPILYLWAAAGALGLASSALLLSPPPEELSASAPSLWRTLGIAAIVLVVTAAIPAVMLFGSVFLWGRAEHEVHLVPAGYEGPVVIIFDDSSGAPERREGRARVYEIPPGGVLRTRLAPNPGWSAPDYYHVDAAGRRTPIVPGSPCADSLPGDPVQACRMPVMYIGGVGMSEGGEPSRPEYESYVVGRRADAAALEARWDSVVRWAVFHDSAYRAP